MSLISIFEKLQIILTFDFEKKKILKKISTCNDSIRRFDLIIINLNIISKLENIDLNTNIEFFENLKNTVLTEINSLMKQLEFVSGKIKQKEQ